MTVGTTQSCCEEPCPQAPCMKPPQLLAVRVPSLLQSPLQPLSKRFLVLPGRAVLTDKFLSSIRAVEKA